MRYKILFTKASVKMLQKIDFPIQKLIKIKLDILSNDFNSLENNLKQLKGDKKIYRLRVADYRVIFEKKDSELVILVIRIGHRKEVYFDI
jgi:mRNA interferase RelE/StbE